MFLKRKINFLCTVKFKTSLFYALLFSMSSFLLFLVVYQTLKSGIVKEIDKQLFALSNKLNDCYLNGGENDFPCDNGKTAPQAIINAAKEAVKGLEIKNWEIEKNQEHSWYELTGISNKKMYTISVSSTNEIIKIEDVGLKARMKFLEDGFNREIYYQGANKIFYRLISPDGKTLMQSKSKSWARLMKTEIYPKKFRLGFPETIKVPSRNKIRILDQMCFDGNILETGISLESEKVMLDKYLIVFVIFFIPFLLISSMAGWMIASKTMKGVERIGRSVNAVSRGDLNSRVEIGREGQEIENLAVAFNNMQAKIESLILGLKEVSDNIAHDLRTPLTRIRGIVETTVNANSECEDYKAMSGEILEECDRLIEMINTMLEITSTDAGTASMPFSEVDLGGLSMRAHELFLPLAEAKNIAFSLKVTPGKHLIHGDLSRLQRMIANMLDNAIKYTQPGGNVNMNITHSNCWEELTVKDNGPGISSNDIEHIFDRFFRGDSSRSQDGNGLGLSLAKAIVKAHKGDIKVHSISGEGTTFIIRIPSLSRAS